MFEAVMTRRDRRKLARKIIRDLKPVAGKLCTAAVFASFGAVMYVKNRLIPKYADDYPYSYIWEGDKHGNLAFGDHEFKRVRNLKDLVKSQVSHYMTWDGRALAESLVQIFLMPDDKKHFDRANTAVMLLQLMISAAIGAGKPVRLKDISPGKAIMLTAGFFMCAPHLIASCFWLTGSMNYMWMGIPQSSFVLPYSMNYFGHKDEASKSLMFLSGLMAGWSTETGAGASMMLAGAGTAYAALTRKYRSWMGWGLAGGILGLALLLAAPGNRKKLRVEQELSDTLPQSLDEALPGYIPLEYLYTKTMFKKWFKEGFMVTILRELPLQIPVLMYFLNGACRDLRTDLYIIALEAAVFAIPAVMMFSPEYPRRATYPTIIYLLAAALCAYDKLDVPAFSKWSYKAKALGVAGSLAYIVCLLASLIVDADLSHQIDEQIRYINDHKDEETIMVEDVMVSPFYERIASDRSITWDVSMGVCLDNADDPYNKAAAAYYGVNRLYCDPLEDYVYDGKDKASRRFRVINPLKSLFIKLREII